MRCYNLDVDEADRRFAAPELDPDLLLDLERRSWDDPEAHAASCYSFFDLRQRTLVGLDQLSAFRIAAQGALRKLRTNVRGSVLYGEVEDALNRYCRVLDLDMQTFASLHETLQEAARKQAQFQAASNSPAAAALALARSTLSEGMREIAVVLLACGEMQRRALDMKMNAQRAIAESAEDGGALVSFSRFADFLEEALAVSEQLRRKHEELQQQRMKAMASAVEARAAVGISGAIASASSPRRAPAAAAPSSGAGVSPSRGTRSQSGTLFAAAGRSWTSKAAA